MTSKITKEQSLYLRKISHDYNNAMAGISGYIELLVSKIKLNEDEMKYVSRINGLIEQTSVLTKRLSKFAHTGVMDSNVLL